MLRKPDAVLRRGQRIRTSGDAVGDDDPPDRAVIDPIR